MDRLKHNAHYFESTEKEAKIVDAYMSIPNIYWPPELFDKVKARCKETGLCGDLIASTVAEWVKEKTLDYLKTQADAH